METLTAFKEIGHNSHRNVSRRDAGASLVVLTYVLLNPYDDYSIHQVQLEETA